MAQQFNPSLQYTYKSKLAGVYMFKKDYVKANHLAMDVLYNGKDDCLENQYYYYAFMSFIKLGRLDSAKYILSIVPRPYNIVDSMNYFNMMAELALSEGDMKKYGEYMSLSKRKTTKILFSKEENTISQIDTSFDSNQLKIKSHHQKISFSYIILVAIVLLLILSVVVLRLRYILHSFVKEKAVINKELESTLNKLRGLQETQGTLEDEKTKQISKIVSYRLSAINELYDSLRFKIQDENKVKKIIPLSSVLKTMNERNEMLNVNLSNSFWEKMILSVNGEYNNIISFVEQKYPNLKERDIQLFCLICAKVTPQIIKLCMNYDNPRTVSNQRNKLIRNKMGLNLSFEQFINAYMKGEIK